MASQLTEKTKTISAIDATAAGATDITSGAIDTAGFDGVRAIAAIGTLTATQVTALRLTHCDTSGGTYTDVDGGTTPNMADGDSDTLLIADAWHTKRFVKVVVDRATANAVINKVIVELYAPRSERVDADATVTGQVIVNAGNS